MRVKRYKVGGAALLACEKEDRRQRRASCRAICGANVARLVDENRVECRASVDWSVRHRFSESLVLGSFCGGQGLNLPCV